MHASALKVPSRKTSQEAQEALRLLGSLGRKRHAARVRIRPEESPDEVSVAVPKEAFELFLEILGQMANGNAVTIMPVHAELTTQQAADMLNVSRPFVVALMEQGKIPHRMVGTHRRVRVADLLEYKTRDDADRDAALAELSAEAQKHGLGYEP
jgi:excisionase family DNA binding protein